MSTKRTRFHGLTANQLAATVAAHATPEERAIFEDRNPLGGRFSNADKDAFDAQCKPQPIRDPMRAEAEGRAMWLERQRTKAPMPRTPDEEMAEAFERARLSDPTEVDESDSIDALYQALVDEMHEEAETAGRARIVHSREELSTDPTMALRHCDGDRKLDAIRRLLNSLGYTRSQYQRMFHDAFIRACLPMSVNEEFTTLSVSCRR